MSTTTKPDEATLEPIPAYYTRYMSASQIHSMREMEAAQRKSISSAIEHPLIQLARLRSRSAVDAYFIGQMHDMARNKANRSDAECMERLRALVAAHSQSWAISGRRESTDGQPMSEERAAEILAELV